MKDKNTLYWIWLSERLGVASKQFPRLVDKYNDPYELYRLEGEAIDGIEGISRGLKLQLNDKSLENAYSILKYCNKNGVDIIAYDDDRYPSRLKNIEDPPVLLYCLGKLPDMNRRLCVGIVGTRKMSEYGKQTAYKISYELGQRYGAWYRRSERLRRIGIGRSNGSGAWLGNIRGVSQGARKAYGSYRKAWSGGYRVSSA